MTVGELKEQGKIHSSVLGDWTIQIAHCVAVGEWDRAGQHCQDAMLALNKVAGVVSQMLTVIPSQDAPEVPKEIVSATIEVKKNYRRKT